MNLPHDYTASASSNTTGSLTLRAEGMDDILANAPANFGGPGDAWSPEDLQVAAIASCFILSFRAIAAASRLEWEKLDVSVTGTLDKVERGMAFTAFATRADLALPTSASRDKALRLLEKAEQTCLITNSLSAPNHLTTAVTGGE